MYLILPNPPPLKNTFLLSNTSLNSLPLLALLTLTLSPRTIDRIHHVHSSTSSEINKTNLDIQKLNENLNEKVAKIEKDNKVLRKDNKTLKKDVTTLISMLERVMAEMKLEIPVQPKEKEEDSDSDSNNERKEEDSTNLKDTKSKHLPHRNSGRRPSFEGREEGEDGLNVLKEDKQKKDTDSLKGASEKQVKEEVATNPMHSEQQEGIQLKPVNNTSNRL